MASRTRKSRRQEERQRAKQRRRHEAQRHAESRHYAGTLLSNKNKSIPLRDFEEFLKMRGDTRVRDLTTGKTLPRSVLSDRVRLVRPYVIDFGLMTSEHAKYVTARMADVHPPSLDEKLLIDLPFPEMWFETTCFSLPEPLAAPAGAELLLTRGLSQEISLEIFRAIAGFVFPISADGTEVLTLKSFGFAVLEDLEEGVYHVEVLGNINTLTVASGKITGKHAPTHGAYIYHGRLSARSIRESRVHAEIYSYLVRLLEVLKSKKVLVGRQQVDLKVTLGASGQRRQGEIREIVYLAPTKDSALSSSFAEGPPIDWTHRWEVAGHWRRVRGVGKDRSGRYVVKGATWVRPHEKGKQFVEPIRKTRIALTPKATPKKLESNVNEMPVPRLVDEPPSE